MLSDHPFLAVMAVAILAPLLVYPAHAGFQLSRRAAPA